MGKKDPKHHQSQYKGKHESKKPTTIWKMRKDHQLKHPQNTNTTKPHQQTTMYSHLPRQIHQPHYRHTHTKCPKQNDAIKQILHVNFFYPSLSLSLSLICL